MGATGMASSLLWYEASAYTFVRKHINPWSPEIYHLNFQSLEVVFRYRDTQLQVTENVWEL